jgi:hypothetical protein
MNKMDVTESANREERKKESGVNKAKRIICFFNDDTFREYFPGDE